MQELLGPNLQMSAFDWWDNETEQFRGGSAGPAPRAPSDSLGSVAPQLMKFAAPLVGQLMEKLMGGNAGSEILQELQIREACIRIEKLQNGGVTPVRCDPVRALGNILADEDGAPMWGRQDMLIFGTRGSGKSATAAWIGELAQQLGERVVSVGYPDRVAHALGFEPTTVPLHKLQDCVVLVEEAGLAFSSSKKKDDSLEKALALARHNNVSLIWNAQNMAQIQRGILRHEALLIFKRVDPFARLFEREEVGDLMTALVAIQTQHPAESPAQTVCLSGGNWALTDVPLPSRWTDQISVMHR